MLEQNRHRDVVWPSGKTNTVSEVSWGVSYCVAWMATPKVLLGLSKACYRIQRQDWIRSPFERNLYHFHIFGSGDFRLVKTFFHFSSIKRNDSQKNCFWKFNTQENHVHIFNTSSPHVRSTKFCWFSFWCETMLNLRSSPRREQHIHSTRLEPTSLPTWKQWRVTTRKTLHEWVPRWCYYIAPWKYIYIYICTQSYSKVKKVCSNHFSQRQQGWKHNLNNPWTISISPFARLSDAFQVGRRWCGDRRSRLRWCWWFFMHINPLLYRMFIYKDLQTYKGIHT